MEKFTLQVLRICAEHNFASITQLTFVLKSSDLEIAESIQALRQLGYVEIDPDHRLAHDLSVDALIGPNTPLRVTISGKSFLESTNDDKKYRTYNEIRAWLTLAIALVALVFSILSYFFKG